MYKLLKRHFNTQVVLGSQTTNTVSGFAAMLLAIVELDPLQILTWNLTSMSDKKINVQDPLIPRPQEFKSNHADFTNNLRQAAYKLWEGLPTR
jgi:hypothetical protein